jgi:hypothetical protein
MNKNLKDGGPSNKADLKASYSDKAKQKVLKIAKTLNKEWKEATTKNQDKLNIPVK